MPDGEWITYNTSGNTIEVITYKTVFGANGLNNYYRYGLYEKYYDSGKLQERGNYEQNQYDGEWRFYYDNASNSLEIKGMYEKGMCIDEWEEWYDNGVLKSKGNYVVINENGIDQWVKNGEWNFYYSDASLKYMATYTNDKLNGPCKERVFEGYWLGQYTNGSRSGTWNLYNLNGTFLKSETY